MFHSLPESILLDHRSFVISFYFLQHWLYLITFRRFISTYICGSYLTRSPVILYYSIYRFNTELCLHCWWGRKMEGYQLFFSQVHSLCLLVFSTRYPLIPCLDANFAFTFLFSLRIFLLAKVSDNAMVLNSQKLETE